MKQTSTAVLSLNFLSLTKFREKFGSGKLYSYPFLYNPSEKVFLTLEGIGYIQSLLSSPKLHISTNIQIKLISGEDVNVIINGMPDKIEVGEVRKIKKGTLYQLQTNTLTPFLVEIKPVNTWKNGDSLISDLFKEDERGCYIARERGEAGTVFGLLC